LFIYYLLLNWLYVSTLQGHHQAFMGSHQCDPKNVRSFNITWFT